MGRDAVVNSPGVESEWIASENKRYEVFREIMK